MTIRPLPGFLKHGDKELGFPHPTTLKRLRAKMGIPEPEVSELGLVRNVVLRNC